MAKKYVLTILNGGPGFTLENEDMELLESAVAHGLADGFFGDQHQLAEEMRKRLNTLLDARPVASPARKAHP